MVRMFANCSGLTRWWLFDVPVTSWRMALLNASDEAKQYTNALFAGCFGVHTMNSVEHTALSPASPTSQMRGICGLSFDTSTESFDSRPCEIQPTIAAVGADWSRDGDSIADTARSHCRAAEHKAKKSCLIRPPTTALNSQRRL